MQRDVGAAASRVAELTAQYDKLIHEVGNTGGAEAGIAIMVRDVEARREIYVDQLKKVNSLQTERRLLSGDARLVSHAELPERPWFPKRLPFITVGAVLASAVGTGFGLLRDRGDRTLRASTNLPQLAGVPYAGYTSWVKRKRGSRWPVMHLHNATPLQEAVRALYGRFVLVPGRAPKTLMISSSEIGEGKAFLTLFLALFAAATKRRILVIEADMRRPTFRKALMLPLDGPGLREYLRSEASLADIITPYHGLHVITAGPGSFRESPAVRL
jgi:polysaccharide biosynthesis transport protein